MLNYGEVGRRADLRHTCPQWFFWDCKHAQTNNLGVREEGGRRKEERKKHRLPFHLCLGMNHIMMVYLWKGPIEGFVLCVTADRAKYEASIP